MLSSRIRQGFQKFFFRFFPIKQLNLSELLHRFEEIEYVLLKIDTPYTPATFPAAYPIGKDLDVLVSSEDYESALKSVRSFVDESGWSNAVVVQEEVGRCKFRFMWLGVLHYQIDVSCDLYLDGAAADILQDRTKTASGYSIPELSRELFYRGIEADRFPEKTHHAKYINRHAQHWDSELAAKYGIELPNVLPTFSQSALKKIAKKVLRRFKFITEPIAHFRRGHYLDTLTSGHYELTVSPEALISAEYENGHFSRYDAIVRLITIEKFLGQHSDAFRLYNKMQSARKAVSGYENRFRALLESVQKNGYHPQSCLEVTNDGYLWDGSHRLALSLYFNVPLVSARMDHRRKGKVDYRLQWFRENGFSDDDCRLIEERRVTLFWEKGLFFPVILWPPVASNFEEIEKTTAKQFTILESNDYSYSDQEFDDMAKSIYAIDDIAPWKVNKKLLHMKKYTKKVRVIWVEFPNPQYRKKEANNATISIVGERLKAEIRNRYKSQVDNYIFDIVCHTADNWLHNRAIMSILSENGTD